MHFEQKWTNGKQYILYRGFANYTWLFFFYDTKTRNVQATSASVTQLVFARGVCFLKNRSNIRKNTA